VHKLSMNLQTFIFVTDMSPDLDDDCLSSFPLTNQSINQSTDSLLPLLILLTTYHSDSSYLSSFIMSSGLQRHSPFAVKKRLDAENLQMLGKSVPGDHEGGQFTGLPRPSTEGQNIQQQLPVNKHAARDLNPKPKGAGGPQSGAPGAGSGSRRGRRGSGQEEEEEEEEIMPGLPARQIT